ncbi:MAG: hypothetical protein M3Z08_16030 [Chloroflexota bacterium]|nr:hypothetical protein [Chloroflexota bacterium]
MTMPLVQVSSKAEGISFVERGSHGFFAVLFRLIVMEIDTLRRRRLSRVLVAVGMGIVIVVLLGIGLRTLQNIHTPASAYAPPLCSAGSHAAGCSNHVPTLADRERYKQLSVKNLAQELIPPGLLQLLNLLLGNALFILLIVLVGSMVGGEYSLGTVRLLFTRGPGRLQFLLAKVLTTAICAVALYLLLTATMLLCGFGLHQIFGLPFDGRFLTPAWLGHTGLFIGWGMLGWFVYGMMALFFGTVGRSTVVGIVGPLIWVSAETILTKLFQLVVGSSSGSWGSVLKSIPDYFVGNSLGSLLQNQGYVVYGGSAGALPNVSAGLMVALYLTLFLGLACWFTVRRDVTN